MLEEVKQPSSHAHQMILLHLPRLVRIQIHPQEALTQAAMGMMETKGKGQTFDLGAAMQTMCHQLPLRLLRPLLPRPKPREEVTIFKVRPILSLLFT
jgi:hypothetical protein